MDKALQKPSAKSAAGIYVEVIGPDGLVHHVGPFKSNADAEAWIAQAAPEKGPRQDDVAKGFATLKSSNLKPRPAE